VSEPGNTVEQVKENFTPQAYVRAPKRSNASRSVADTTQSIIFWRGLLALTSDGRAGTATTARLHSNDRESPTLRGPT
jgi:hypothetical protein